MLAAGSACAGGWAGYWTTSAWPAVAWWVLLVTGVGLAAVDLREHRLPTPLIAAAALGVAVALTVAAARDSDWSSWWQAVATAATAFVVFYVMAMASGMGYGDVKLAAVIAGSAGYSSPTLAAGTLLAGLLVAGLAGLALLAAGRGRGHQLALGPCLLLGTAAGLAVLGHAG